MSDHTDHMAAVQRTLGERYLHGQVYQAMPVTSDPFEEPTDLHITPPPETVLDEAARITSEDRPSDYGPPEENHARTAGLWSAYLGINITPRMVCWLNVLQKASRDRHKPKRDNVVDGIGFLANTERLD